MTSRSGIVSGPSGGPSCLTGGPGSKPNGKSKDICGRSNLMGGSIRIWSNSGLRGNGSGRN